MSDTSTATPRSPRPARSRLAALVRAEVILLRRNKLALFNAFVMPALPFLLLIPIRVNGNMDNETTSLFLGLVVALSLMFVIYYNLLSTFVSRREELVLKRLRSGECSDTEIIGGISIPAMAIGLIVFAFLGLLTVVALGQPLPVNALLLLLAVVGGSLVFTGLALVTTIITKNSEAAQLTSLPIVLICMFGAGFSPLSALPAWATTALRFTPLAPSYELTRLGWGGVTQNGRTVDLVDSFTQAALPAGILLGWIVIAGFTAREYFRWEPRT